tara:strand:- start:144 stop:491 length:348 start_codon:yes stop_codon:yes gene_type:complete
MCKRTVPVNGKVYVREVAITIGSGSVEPPPLPKKELVVPIIIILYDNAQPIVASTYLKYKTAKAVSTVKSVAELIMLLLFRAITLLVFPAISLNLTSSPTEGEAGRVSVIAEPLT